MRHQTAIDAVASIQSGQRIFVHGGAATPNALLHAICERSTDLHDLEFVHLHVEGDAPHADARFASRFRVTNLFVGGNMRGRFDGARVDYLPCFLSEIPTLLRSGRRRIDVALVHLSPPDRHGYCSLGVSVDVAVAAMRAARTVIAQINPNMPRMHGDGFVHVDDVDHWTVVDEPLPECSRGPIAPEEMAIGRYVAELIEDGSTLQMGIGRIPDAVLASLSHHKDLGVHTEMFSDGLIELIECGAVNNSRKAVHPGKTVSGFVMGSRRLYDFIDDDPSIALLAIDYVNNATVIRRNPKVVAVNSAVEVDLSGQVCADSIGHRIISGVGGQMDFIRGASLSEGGKPIIALTSRTARGTPRIVPRLKPGAGVVTTRGHVHYVATEYGVADLYGRTLGERARALINIAHPDDREGLEASWREVLDSFA